MDLCGAFFGRCHNPRRICQVSILGDLAVKAEMQSLLDYLDSLKTLPPGERLGLLRERIEATLNDASVPRSKMLGKLDAAAKRVKSSGTIKRSR
jgi:hypothetical protein